MIAPIAGMMLASLTPPLRLISVTSPVSSSSSRLLPKYLISMMSERSAVRIAQIRLISAQNPVAALGASSSMIVVGAGVSSIAAGIGLNGAAV